jgi:hypothetical protein
VHTAFALLRLALEQPQLLSEHAAAYSALLASEGTDALAQLQRRLLLQLLGLAALAVALVLAGVAWMLVLALPGTPASVWLVPLPALLAAGAAAWAVRRPNGPAPFALLREQLQIDFPARARPLAARPATAPRAPSAACRPWPACSARARPCRPGCSRQALPPCPAAPSCT